MAVRVSWLKLDDSLEELHRVVESAQLRVRYGEALEDLVVVGLVFLKRLQDRRSFFRPVLFGQSVGRCSSRFAVAARPAS